MHKVILVTGGARSGKSYFAGANIMKRFYLAAFLMMR